MCKLVQPHVKLLISDPPGIHGWIPRTRRIHTEFSVLYKFEIASTRLYSTQIHNIAIDSLLTGPGLMQ